MSVGFVRRLANPSCSLITHIVVGLDPALLIFSRLSEEFCA